MNAAGRQLSPGEVYEEPTIQQEEYRQNLNIRLICKECRTDPPLLAEETSSGDTVCAECGLVLQSHVVDTRSEWRTFANDDQGNDDPSRVGEAANPLLDGSQLNSNIAFTSGDIRSKELNRAQSKLNNDKHTKNLTGVYKQISTLCQAYQLSAGVANGAMANFKAADDSKQFRGKSQEVMIAACVFIACRQNDAGRSFKEIMTLTRVPKKEIGRTFKALEKFFKREAGKENVARIQAAQTGTQYQAKGSSSADELVGRYCSQLGLSTQVGVISQDCTKSMGRVGSLAGRSPLSIAAVAIYLISHLFGEGKTAKEIGEVAGVSDGTIRSAYKLVYADRQNIIKPEWIRKGGDMDKVPTS